ncbi:MAG: molybdopterin-dependent oxidoreductase, partial [Candidatus Eremiobacteraeota bacterium]|nr:molybdopterin-dependent oxidoreductase [Candidatus Eremiobacteraeota bacterium]
ALTSKTYRFKSRPWDLHRTQTTCMQCSVGCQLHIDERHGNVLRTMSVATDDSISDGWLCDRGRYNVGFYDDERRLKTPLLRNGDEWLEIDWEDAIGMWAAAIKDALTTDGTQSIGAIGGGRLLNEEALLLQDVHRKLGVTNLDWRAGRQRQATPGKRGGTNFDLENAEAIILLGQPPAETAPVLDLRIRKAVYRRGATLLVVASTAAPYPVPLRSVGSLQQAWDLIPHGAQRIAFVWDGIDLTLGLELERSLAGVWGDRQIVTYIPAEQPNARGAEVMGMHPNFGPGFTQTAAGLDTSKMFERAANGGMRVLSILGANPALHFYDGALACRALEKTPFVVVSDLFMTQTAQSANLVLPARASFEKTGTTINLSGDVLPVNAGLRPPDGTRSDLEMLICLSEALSVGLPTMAILEQRTLLHLAHDPLTFGFAAQAMCGPVAVSQPPGAGLHVAFESRIFAGGGTVAFDDRIASLRPLPEAAFSAADACRLGLKTADYVDLKSTGETLHDLLVVVRPALEEGTVVLIDGLPDEPANALPVGAPVEVVNVRKAGGELAAVGAVG